MYGVIYKAINKVNGKVYIGQTIRDFDDRVRQHIADAVGMRNSHYVFHIAIRKYGEENFVFEIIDKADTEEELNEKELFWIKHLKSYIRDEKCNGYNMTIGGSGLGCGENHPRYGVKASDETRLKMSKSKKLLTGEKNPFYGKSHTDDTKEKIRKARKERGIGIGNSYAKGKNIGADNSRAKPVIQLTKDGEFIAEYDTAWDGAIAVGGCNSTIGKVCKGRQRTHKGFKWMYKEDYTKQNT